jgi:type II secretory pathway pseudopilin PulG
MNEKRGQVWVETVIYTLIGLIIIGTLVAVATPKLIRMNDQITISQTTETLNKLNEQIRNTLPYAGNQREVVLVVKKGEYTLDAINDTIFYTLKNTGLKYGEPNVLIREGDIYILTTSKANNKYDVTLLLNYSIFNLTYQSKDINKVLTAAPAGYKFLIVNKDGKNIDIQSI